MAIEFQDAAGQLVDVGTVNLSLSMPMGNMTMQGDVVVRGKGGSYVAKAKPEMAGRWIARLSYSGPHGSGQKTFQVAVR